MIISQEESLKQQQYKLTKASHHQSESAIHCNDDDKLIEYAPKQMRQIHSSDYDDEDDGEYEEVGFEDYDVNYEDGDVIIPIPNGQRRSSIILAPPMNELKENEFEGESDDDGDEEYFRGARDVKKLDFLNDEP